MRMILVTKPHRVGYSDLRTTFLKLANFVELKRKILLLIIGKSMANKQKKTLANELSLFRPLHVAIDLIQTVIDWWFATMLNIKLTEFRVVKSFTMAKQTFVFVLTRFRFHGDEKQWQRQPRPISKLQCIQFPWF